MRKKKKLIFLQHFLLLIKVVLKWYFNKCSKTLVNWIYIVGSWIVSFHFKINWWRGRHTQIFYDLWHHTTRACFLSSCRESNCGPLMYILNRKFISNSKDQWVLLRLYEESYESSNDFALKFVSNSSCSIIIEIGRKLRKCW